MCGSGDVWFGGVSFRSVWLGVCLWLKEFFAKHMVTNTEGNENGRATSSPNGQRKLSGAMHNISCQQLYVTLVPPGFQSQGN